MKATSTVEKGDLLRDYVATLLRAAQHTNVETEKMVGGKKVDVYYEETGSLWETKKVCVECKNYTRPLTKEDFKDIYNDYNPLVSANLSDNVLIVSKLPINTPALEYLRTIPYFRHITISEFENKLLDFSIYTRSLLAQYNEGGLSNYYVNQQTEDGVGLQETILDWISSSACKPMAILAGYGMGKTSFSRHISHYLAHQHIKKPTTRMPILIPLGEIAAEQSLEGLIGKILGADGSVRNYNFHLFMELNRRGRFVVILDGFDEMKHTMTWHQFQYNFRQLNRLVEGDSRVLLLGRPSAFMSDEEHKLVLRGTRKIRDKELQTTEWKNHKITRISVFTSEQSYEFISRYIGYLEKVRSKEEGREEDVDYITSRIDELKDQQYIELISRPVQAKMLAELAIDRNVELKAFSHYELYELFINRIMERELSKAVSQRFGAEDRKEFISTIAWHFWVLSGVSSFRMEEIPAKYISKYVDRETEEASSVSRDLVSRSILETKSSEAFYFPHRSFQEFLVAQRIQDNEWKQSELTLINKAMQPEVVKFIKESGNKDKIARLYHHIEGFRGTLGCELLKLVGWSIRTELDMASVEAGSDPWRILILGLNALSEPGIEEAPDFANSKIDSMVRKFQQSTDKKSKLMWLAIICLITEGTAVDSDTDSLILSMVIGQTFDQLDQAVKSFEQQKKRRGRPRIVLDLSNPFCDILATSIKASKNSGGDVALQIDWSAFSRKLATLLAPDFGVDEFLEYQIKTGSAIRSLGELARVNMQFSFNEKGGVVTSFFKHFADPGKLVPVRGFK